MDQGELAWRLPTSASINSISTNGLSKPAAKLSQSRRFPVVMKTFIGQMRTA
jgi:hypothetical protein